MEISIQNPCNLGIETSHSSQNGEVEVNRNWLELPPDVMSLILLKLGVVSILVTAQWVCSSWWKLSKQPHLFRSINVQKFSKSFGSDINHALTEYNPRLWTLYGGCDDHYMEKLAKEAVNRSCGQLVEFHVRHIATDGLLQHISEKSSSLKCLQLVSCHRLTDDGLTEMAKTLAQLEELEICCCSFSKGVFETIGRMCPNLKSFCVNFVCSYLNEYTIDGVAPAIAENMPGLCHLNLFGSTLTDDGLRAILDGCPHLKSLDLRLCFNLKFAGDLKERLANIKLRFPNDPTDDFEYAIEIASDEEDYLDIDDGIVSDEEDYFDTDDETFSD